MPETTKIYPEFDDTLPVGMTPAENDSEEKVIDDLPLANAPAPVAKMGSFEERSKALFAAEVVPWADVRKMTPGQVDAELVSRGLFSQKELDTINALSEKLKGSVRVDEMKVNVLAPGDRRAGDFYNLYAAANFKEMNPMAVRFSMGEGLPQLTLPVKIKPYAKKDGSIGVEVTALETKHPSLYVIGKSNDRLFPPLSKNMSDAERNLATSLREFEMAFLDRNGIAVRASVDSKGNITTKPVDVRLWNEESKSWEVKPCFIYRNGADYRLNPIPVDKIMDRLEDNPNRKVWMSGTSYMVDLSKESPEARYNIAAGGGAWVKGTDPAGNVKNLYVVYSGTDKYANIKVGTSPRALREEMRERAAAKQDVKKARENKLQNEQKPEAKPQRSIR